MPFHPPRGLRASLYAGQPAFGFLAGSNSAHIFEIGAASGLDFAIIDGEHGDGIGIAEARELIRAADAFRLPSVVRVPSNDGSFIQRVLDLGAIGICVPHIRTAADAAAAVAAARYAPEGVRAMSPLVRQHAFAGGHEWAESWLVANAEVIVLLIVEDREGIDNLGEIAAVPGVDAIWIGTGDLAQDLGFAGNPDASSRIQPHLDKALEESLRHGVIPAIPLSGSVTSDPADRRAQFDRLFGRGYRLFFWTEGNVLRSAFDALLKPVRASD